MIKPGGGKRLEGEKGQACIGKYQAVTGADGKAASGKGVPARGRVVHEVKPLAFAHRNPLIRLAGDVVGGHGQRAFAGAVPVA